jgi:hypothetical protein
MMIRNDVHLKIDTYYREISNMKFEGYVSDCRDGFLRSQVRNLKRGTGSTQLLLVAESVTDEPVEPNMRYWESSAVPMANEVMGKLGVSTYKPHFVRSRTPLQIHEHYEQTHRRCDALGVMVKITQPVVENVPLLWFYTTLIRMFSIQSIPLAIKNDLLANPSLKNMKDYCENTIPYYASEDSSGQLCPQADGKSEIVEAFASYRGEKEAVWETCIRRMREDPLSNHLHTLETTGLNSLVYHVSSAELKILTLSPETYHNEDTAYYSALFRRLMNRVLWAFPEKAGVYEQTEIGQYLAKTERRAA